MHIPDGYLSPSTCAVGYAIAAPFWYVALTRVKRLLQTRLVPLLAAVSAFSFVVMMFNLPIPGGTTAHSVGMGVAAIVLGPWAAILAISIALMIQALFFGDGGITAYGVNCINMAIIGSLVAYAVYQAIAGRAPIASARRIVAGAIAGYVAINVAAFAAGCEFGVQPLLFHDATGAPLYAPYPLSVAIPAMMLAHLTLAGAAEAIITPESSPIYSAPIRACCRPQRWWRTIGSRSASALRPPADGGERGRCGRIGRVDGGLPTRAARRRHGLGRVGD